MISEDFNADGRPDLAVAGGSVVSILLANGSGNFLSKTDFTTGSDANSVISEDFNADGRPDLATANSSSNSVSILLGTGTGSFGAKTDFTAGLNPSSVISEDFNGDGSPDLAVANFSSDSVSILLGTGTGSFGAKTDFATGSNPISVTGEDFNGDSRPDLAVANNGIGTNTVSVLLGNGTGSLGAKTDFTTGTSAQSVTSEDFNADGRPDLAVANAGSASVSILLGSGDGAFGAKTDFTTGTGPRSVTSEDFNGDGRPDLAVGNFFSNSASILLGDAPATSHPNLRSHAFGRVALGQPSTSRQITFRNGGGARLEVGNVQLTGDGANDFSIRTDNCSAIVLKVEDACSVFVRFDPEAEGFAQAGLRLTSNAPDSPRSIALSGFAAPAGDTDPPETSITSGPSGTTIDSTPTFAFISDEAGTFECRTDGDTFAVCATPSTLAALPDGFHTFEVRAKDTAGNIDPNPATRSFTVDTTPPAGDITPPDVFFTSGPAGLTNFAAPSFGFAMNEAGSLQCRTDGSQFTACTSPTVTASLNDGPHTFEVRAIDTAGNSSTVSRSIQVDTIAPTVTISSPAQNSTLTTSSASVSFNADEAVSGFECRIDSGAFAPCSSPSSFSGMTAGSHTVQVKATDRAQNTGAAATTSFTVNTAAPSKATINKLSVTGPAKVKKGKKATYKVKVSNSGNANATGVSLKVSGKGVSLNTSIGEVAAGKTRTVKVKLEPKKTGKIKVTFKVTSSNAGGKTVKKTITVTK